MKKIILIVGLIIIALAIGTYFYRQATKSRQRPSEVIMGNQTWSGEKLITGDVYIEGNLTVLPGTIVRFAVGDDQNSGEEIEPDGFNNSDPTRLLKYEKTHSGLYVTGKLTAVGTPDKQIIFTSAAKEPNYADWVSLGFGGDGSIIEHCIVEWSRNSITPGRNQPNTIIRNNVIRNTFWGAIGAGFSGAHIYNNEIWEAGHEGIDVQGGNPIIENNVIYDSHSGIVILKGSATVRNNTMINVGGGVHVDDRATPTLKNNSVELAPKDSTKEWRYGDFAYTMRKEK
ncbi:right-handed parallel beta-helix repeat-containing protein [Patescibacteria group bacterium]|nr:right-handed parallel beta-helix repeat-containing protein [Patescibacteria group bacterium]MBU0777387.1 right-handed parallel beta-helix repeat-containing protein [Patescibacteria group bacterium]MBU0846023.1 right-handed parallel beta-helix repeat-containing protein [Patescibacteria group bacterium]MBU0922477.1 right-handed parallel beta-helix repeat-containing protein [Patescibacteria group bacterium]MBU1066790.1 right-handed parallel beta-helix repeat-containing protein [Patescibacteria 